MGVEKKTLVRCGWPKTELMRSYHDEEWGTPLHDDASLFEFLVLSGMQAGLSWKTILYRRENYRRAFDRFDPEAVARYGRRKLNALLSDAGIIRNRMKIAAAIENAKAAVEVRKEFGSLDAYLWKLAGGRPKINRWRSFDEVPAVTEESVAMSEALRSRRFKFVGPTICYAFMQSVGMVNDHLLHCFRRAELAGLAKGKTP